MKTRRRLVLLLAFGLVGGATGPAHGQGIVSFANSAPGVNAPFYDTDGVTRLSGTNYCAALYAGPGDSPPESWIQAGASASFGPNGYWSGGNRTLPNYLPGSAVGLQVRFWETKYGATFQDAEMVGGNVGVSQPIIVVLYEPPSATPMFGLQSASLVPVLTLSRGLPGMVTDSSTVANGTQLASLCGVPVGVNRWFRVTSPTPGEASLTTVGSAIDTVMSAFEGSIVSPSTLTLITCNDNRAAGATASEVRFPVAANKLYLVCVAGKNGASGTIQFNYSLATRLRMLRAASGGVELSWPADATNFIAEATTNLSEAAAWQVLTNPPVTLTNRRVLQLDCPWPQAIYRLRLGSGTNQGSMEFRPARRDQRPSMPK